MIDVHTLYLAGLVSQATFALTLTLLAWSDRRTKGMPWLAGACALQFVWTASRSFGQPEVTPLSAALSSCLLVLLLAFVYMGFRWFVVRRSLRSSRGPLAVGAAILMVFCVSLARPVAGYDLSRIAAIALGAITVRMLWRTHLEALRVTARICGVLVTVVLFIIAVRLVMDEPPENWIRGAHDTAQILLMRAITFTSVTLLSFSFFALFVAETNRRLHDETRTDILTGLRNRRAMEEAAAREVRLALRNKSPLALLMMDLDRFKALNDTWGHALGDRALRTLGSVLLTGTRAADFTARMGGEEFAVLLPGRRMAEAAALAERLRATVEEMRFGEAEQDVSVTVSIGVSVLHPDEDGWTAMLSRADDALYRAKHEGRNRVAICTVEESPSTREGEDAKTAWRRRWSLPKQGPLL